MPTVPLESPLATIGEIATALNKTPQRIGQMIACGDLPSLRLGNRTYVPRSALQALADDAIQQHRQRTYAVSVRGDVPADVGGRVSGAHTAAIRGRDAGPR